MNADDLAVQLYAELRKHPHDAMQFIRDLIEQKSTAELTDLVVSNDPDESVPTMLAEWSAMGSRSDESRHRLTYSASESR